MRRQVVVAIACAACGTGVDGASGYFFDPVNPPMNAWDFTNVWASQPGTYPTLQWLVGR